MTAKENTPPTMQHRRVRHSLPFSCLDREHLRGASLDCLRTLRLLDRLDVLRFRVYVVFWSFVIAVFGCSVWELFFR